MTNVTIPQVEGGQTTSPTMAYTMELDSGSASVYSNLSDVLKLAIPEGYLINGYISPSVASNNLTLAILTTAGAAPSASDPVLVRINGTIRTVTAATTCVLAAGTNWFNLGAAEFAALEQDLFAYAVWDSNSSVVAIAPARIPNARLVSDFSATSTNEKFIGNQSNYTSTDDVCVVGRFAATLSAAASYNWSVPTYTNLNLVKTPTYETRWLSYSPTRTNVTAGTGPTANDGYQIRNRNIEVYNSYVFGTGGSLGGALGISLPFAPSSAIPPFYPAGNGVYRTAAGTRNTGVLSLNAGSLLINASNASATYLSDSSVVAAVPFVWTTSDRFILRYSYPI